MLTNYLNKLLAKNDLTSSEMEQAFEVITGGEVAPAQIGAFLAALRMKGESCAELVGAARVLRRAVSFIDCGDREVTDVVGTGGDGSNSFNISTTAAFVAAGAGVTVAKHGNRAASSKCGAADVLGALGYNLEAAPAVIKEAILKLGIGFLFAQKLHPILANVAAIRRQLKIRTIFNMLGPLCNPAGARSMVLGVYAPEMTELFARVLQELGVRRAMVVHGLEGIDEISCAAPTQVAELRDGAVHIYRLQPEILLSRVYNPEELKGGDPQRNAEILLSVLDNSNQGAPRAAVLLNAGATIYVAGLADTLEEGIKKAATSIDSGAALGKLKALIEVSHGINS